MTSRRRRRRAAARMGNGGPAIALLVVGAVVVAGIIGLFVLLGDGESGPSGELLEPTAEDHVLGELTAPVTVVEYADFQ